VLSVPLDWRLFAIIVSPTTRQKRPISFARKIVSAACFLLLLLLLGGYH
jgi:hypothetical protein